MKRSPIQHTAMQYITLGLVVILALAMLWLPLGAEAEQTGKVARIGLLSPFPPPAEAERQPIYLLDALRQVLHEQGWVEGQNLVIEQRYAAGQYEQLPALAAELVRLPVDVIVALGTAGAQAAKRATSTLPIVFALVSDPVGSGVVASLARPGANVTGVALLPTWEIAQKRLQLFTEAVPQVSRVAVLWNPANPAGLTGLREVEKAARALGVQLHALAVRDLTELEQAFHAIINEQANGLFVNGDPVLDTQRRRIAQFAIEHRLPTMSLARGFVEAGGLMSYGASVPDMYRSATALVVQVLRGVKPADLPVELPRKFELLLNLKTAKALGITFPPTLLIQADEVIQ